MHSVFVETRNCSIYCLYQWENMLSPCECHWKVCWKPCSKPSRLIASCAFS